jgi:hypothetical protein
MKKVLDWIVDFTDAMVGLFLIVVTIYIVLVLYHS